MPKFSELPAASALTGAETVPIVQGTTTSRTTVAGIAGFGGAGSKVGTNYELVTDYSGQVSGSDWRTAIVAARDAAGVGGTVAFPYLAGGYGLSASVQPLERQRWIGTHSPLYDWDNSPNTSCYLKALSGFTGGGLIHYTSTSVGRGALIQGLGFVGLGDATGALNGIDFGPASGAERSVMVRDCQFYQFGGAALAGHMWVIDLENLHITRCGYGIRPASGAAGTSCQALDNRWNRLQIYFTFHHGISLDGAAEHGQIAMSNIRSERAGTTVGTTVDPNSNRDQTACGMYVTRASVIQMVNYNTDANAGPGLKMVGAVNNGSVNNVTGNIILKRDNTGDNATTVGPGLWVEQTTYVHLIGKITYGDPNDGGAGYTAPQRGVWSGGNNWFVWDGTVQLETTGNGGPGNTQAVAYAIVPTASAVGGVAPVASYQSPARDPRYTSLTAMP